MPAEACKVSPPHLVSFRAVYLRLALPRAVRLRIVLLHVAHVRLALLRAAYLRLALNRAALCTWTPVIVTGKYCIVNVSLKFTVLCL